MKSQTHVEELQKRTALERSVEKLLGDLIQVYSRKTSPLSHNTAPNSETIQIERRQKGKWVAIEEDEPYILYINTHTKLV